MLRVKTAIFTATVLLLTAAISLAAEVRDPNEEIRIFESYFPDSNEAGQELDEWWKNRQTEQTPPITALEILRKGLRRTTIDPTMLIGWVGAAYANHEEAAVRDKAAEMLIAATYSPQGYARHFAVYYGLAGIQQKSAEVLERLAKLAVSNESVNRIVWGVKYTTQESEFLLYVEPYLWSPDAKIAERAKELKKLFEKETEHWEEWQPPSGQSKPARRDDVDYETAFSELYETLGLSYPCFDLKGIDWDAVGRDMLPRAKEVETDEEFGLLCIELVAKLEDSHAYVLAGAIEVPEVPTPQWDAGFSCLEDDRDRAAVYYIDPGGPAEKAGVKIGMAVLKVDDANAGDVIHKTMAKMRKYGGFSSERYLRYFAFRGFMRQMEKGREVKFEMIDPKGNTQTFNLAAELGQRYVPHLPVPIEGIRDSANVSYKMLDDEIGYIYVRRIRNGLEASLDKALSELQGARGLILDVRGNSGGGFNGQTSHVNFYTDTPGYQGTRPQYTGPIAILIGSRCISAGEGWTSWFVAKKRARLFGEATAGASAKKEIYLLKNSLFKVQYPVRPYNGFLDRPIERRGLEPDVPVKQTAEDLANGRDTVLEAASAYLGSR
ncbi:MAG: hypothetical protein JW720_06025 [Sedimentisphaerales bacterium]|nr:hypothetical protein [Sedimentisphaerales bacterium]